MAKEFPIKFHKNLNDAWYGSAYFVNDVLCEKHVVTVTAAPKEKKAPSINRIKAKLFGFEETMRLRHYGWYRVTEEEYNKFVTK